MTQERFFALGASYGLTFAPDESALFVVAARVQRCCDLRTGKRTHSVAWAHGSDLDVSPDGRRLAVTNTSGDVVMFDALTMEQLWMSRGGGFGEGPGPRFVAGGEGFVTASWGGDLVVRAAATGEILLHEHHEGRMISGLACSPDRTQFVLASSFERGSATHVRPWPFAEHAEEAVLFATSAQAVALDGSGRLAVQGHDRTLAVVDLERRTVLAKGTSDHVGTAALAWAPTASSRWSRTAASSASRATRSSHSGRPRCRMRARSPTRPRACCSRWVGGSVAKCSAARAPGRWFSTSRRMTRSL